MTNNSEVVLALARDPQLMALISSQIADTLDRRQVEREARILKILGALSAIVLFVGYTGIERMIETSSTSAAQTAVEKKSSETEVPLTLALLSMSVTRADSKGSFTHSERAAMIAHLERLAEARKRGHDLKGDAQFISTLESVIDTMASSGNGVFVDKAFDLFFDDCLAVGGIVETLLLHYGRHAVGAIGESRTDALKRFQAVERTAITHKVPEYAIPHRLLIEFEINASADKRSFDAAMQQLGSLEGPDRDKAWEFITEYATHEFSRRKRPHTLHLQQVAIRFLREHRLALEKMGFGATKVIAQAARKT